jgi:hypothetical protein
MTSLPNARRKASPASIGSVDREACVQQRNDELWSDLMGDRGIDAGRGDDDGVGTGQKASASTPDPGNASSVTKRYSSSATLSPPEGVLTPFLLVFPAGQR